jgi:Domain of unknown function (DUF5060)
MSLLRCFLFVLLAYPNSASFIRNLILYDASFNPAINLGVLSYNSTIDLAVVGTSLTILAEVDAAIHDQGSLLFVFDESFTNKENYPFYALNGNSGTYFRSFPPMTILGQHTISTQLFNGSTDTVLETKTVSFTVIDSSNRPSPFAGFTLINTNTNQERELPEVVTLAEVGASISIVAKTRNIFVDDVSFWFDGKFICKEKDMPWAIGRNSGTTYFPFKPMAVPGNHTVLAVALVNGKSTGSISFSFVVQADASGPIADTMPSKSPVTNFEKVAPTLGTQSPNTGPPTSSPVAVSPPVPSPPISLPVAVPTPIVAPISPKTQLETVHILGELQKWHKLTLAFTGPFATETDVDVNPFMDYRLDVTFTHSTARKQYVVPGYFAADGNAAETSSSSGNQWYCHFAPDEIGLWQFDVAFVTGKNVAVNEGGTPAAFNGESGSFLISPSDKTGRDHRGKGRLRYVGEHHLQFGEGEWFLKAGVDSPENFLAYEDFDNTPNYRNRRKTWGPHKVDYEFGNPSWQGGKGTGIIGAINYLSNQGLNAFSFLTMNIAGDDRNVFPYISDSAADRLRMDVSKLAQWEILFGHADQMGMFMHFKLAETENDELLDGGLLGNERKLYYREIIARFSHHLALNWNLSEEINNPIDQVKAFADYIKTTDPYKHIIVFHTTPNGDQYLNLTGHPTIDGISVQDNPSKVFENTLRWITNSANDGHKWIVSNDEQNSAFDGVVPDQVDPNHDNIREKALWGNIMVRTLVQFSFTHV